MTLSSQNDPRFELVPEDETPPAAPDEDLSFEDDEDDTDILEV